MHIVHLSSADSLQQIAAAKQKGLPITVETGQHYLYFNAEEIEDGRTEFKCAPPIREKENNDQLWQALQEGLIDFVATDHSPATPSLKEIESGDFMKAWGGIASIQFALPVLWTAAKKRNATFNDIAKWLCENPAKLINKENSKGKIAAGFDADLIVLDDEKIFTVTKEIILHKHKVTPYINEQLYGVVEQVYLAGEKVFADGKMLLTGFFNYTNNLSCGGTITRDIVLVDENGYRDSVFTSNICSGGTMINEMAIQNNGKVLLGGTFTQFSGVGKNRLVSLNVYGNLGLDEHIINKLILYPNPANSILNVQTNNNDSINKIQITDLTGKIIVRQSENTNQVNIENFASGMYIIEAFNGEGKFMSKFMKN